MTGAGRTTLSDLEIRLDSLKSIIGRYDSAAVAFSGGVDSTFLLGVASGVLGDGLVAITAVAPFVPAREFGEAKSFAASLGVRHEIVEVGISDIELFAGNPPDRCYHCKKALFGRILSLAGELGRGVVMDASNVDDASDYRPGMKALRELKVLSPLREAGLAKKEIRELSRRLGFPGYDRPAAACLASRIPFGEEITPGKLDRIEKAEEYLAEQGFRVNRVRSHGDLARIEVSPDMMGALMAPSTRERIAERFRALGFRYITIDAEGYRMGSLNESLDI